MSVAKIRGIIIREIKSGEADKFITILCKDIGKITVFAKGACNTKSKFLAGTALFTYGDFIIRTASKTPTLNSVDIIESFSNITSDLDRYYCGVYILEFALKALPDVTDNNNYIMLLIKALQKINSGNYSSILIVRIFEIKMLIYLGYSPYNESCSNCGAEMPSYISLNGLVCHNCIDSLSIKISDTAIYTLKYIYESNLDNLFQFKISQSIFNEISNISEKYISYYLECKFNSYDYIKNLTIDN